MKQRVSLITLGLADLERARGGPLTEDGGVRLGA
jgi:hypothetical protein